MERRNSKEWINSLKIAIINNDIKKIEEYSSRELPSYFASINEAKEALNLIEQAANILKEKKDIISKQLKQLKQNKQYIQTSYQNSTFNFEA